MKPFCIILTLFVFSHQMKGQSNTTSSHKIPDPQYVNNVYYLQADSLITLEQTEARMKSKTKAFGYGGSEAGFVMDGEKSMVRIKAGDTIRFAIKLAMSLGDPSMMIKLYKFNPKKGNREAIISSQGGIYNSGKNTADANEVKFNVQKPTPDTFIIIPSSGLAAGEYGFLNMMMVHGSGMKLSYTVFAFGVD
jgi:hypothetical protein